MNPRKEAKKLLRVRHAQIIKQIDKFLLNSTIEIGEVSIQRHGLHDKFIIRKRKYVVTPKMLWVGANGKKRIINSFEFFNSMKYGITVLKWMGIQVNGRLINNEDFFREPFFDTRFIKERVVKLKSCINLTSKLASMHEDLVEKVDIYIDEYLNTDNGRKDLTKSRDHILEKSSELEFLDTISEANIKFMYDNMDSLHKFMESLHDNCQYTERMSLGDFKDLILESRVYTVMKN